MKRSIVATILILSALAGLATGVFLPAFAHNTSKKPPLRCGVVTSGQINPTTGKVTPRHGKQPCATPMPRYQHYTWTSGGAHSPFMAVPAHWTLSYICDGGPGTLEVLNHQWLLERVPMTCDTIWHREPFEDTGAVQLWASREADFLVA